MAVVPEQHQCRLESLAAQTTRAKMLLVSGREFITHRVIDAIRLPQPLKVMRGERVFAKKHALAAHFFSNQPCPANGSSIEFRGLRKIVRMTDDAPLQMVGSAPVASMQDCASSPSRRAAVKCPAS